MPSYDQNYILGRGRLMFARFPSSSPTTAEVNAASEHYLGNTPSLEYTIEEEVLEHFSSDAGLRTKDRSVTLSNDASGSFTVDNISAETLALFMASNPGDGTGTNANFFGIRTVAQSAISTAVDEAITAPALDRWYQLGLSAAGVPTIAKVAGIGARNVTITAITGASGSPVADTDYELDSALGRLWIPSGGMIAADDELTVSWTAAAATYTVVEDGDQSVYGRLRFISANAVGDQRNYVFPYVKLTPNGSIQLKGDDWQQASFNMEVLALNSNTKRIYTYT